MSAEVSTSFTIGQRVRVRIHDVAFGGEGVGRVVNDEVRVSNESAPGNAENRSTLDTRHSTFPVIFVPFTAVGEEVEVEITELKKNFARGKVVQILQPSPARVTPGC